MKIVLLLGAAVAAQAQAYRFGRVWDGEKVVNNAVIVVEKDRIKSIGPRDGEAIDMTRYTALPGLFDVHTHMTYVLDMARHHARPDAARRRFICRRTTRKRRSKPESPRCATWARATMPTSPCAT